MLISIELDHQNRGGFAAIVRDFESRHGVGALLEHIHKPAGSSRRTLSEPLRSEFVQLHRVCTDNWGAVVALSRQQHRDLTQKRKRDEETLH
eukprot:COSAG01_NODE_8517_length_2756_cov_4.083553_2_plen_92_part_00